MNSQVRASRKSQSNLTYAAVGVNRSKRDRARISMSRNLLGDSNWYPHGKPLQLPFGLVFPSERDSNAYYDLQIEGVGTKTLLAESSGIYDTIGIDAVAMVVNDVLRSGARPLLLSDAIHIANSDELRVRRLVEGVRKGAMISKCFLASGETGNVAEILHPETKIGSPPFDLMAACLGVVRKSELISGQFAPGDDIIGLRSSGIHSNGLTLARRVLLKAWGGKFAPWSRPDLLRRPLIQELLEPTKIYVDALVEAQQVTDLKASIHITGDGFGKFRRLIDWRRRFKRASPRVGLRFEGLREMPSIFRLIYDTARERHTPITISEMFQTFNMGYGFAILTNSEYSNKVVDSINKHCEAEIIGHVVSDRDERISVSTPELEKPIAL